MAALFRLQRSLIKRLIQPTISNTRTISTSKKNSDTVTATTEAECQPQTQTKSKNWVSFGFYEKDEQLDREATHATFFFAVTLCIVFGGFIYAYMPDYQLRDWSQREAYLEIRRREQAGLPLVDPNLIDPSKFTLPSDEELGDMEIII